MTSRTAALTVGVLMGTILAAAFLNTTNLRESEAANAATIVPVELVLLVDTSGSVDAGEYAQQRQGYSEAFRHDEVKNLVVRGGGIAVTYIEWSSADHQNTRIGWTHLKTEQDCRNFADQIDLITREVEGSTKMAPALKYAADCMAQNEYLGIRRVIDVSGDGHCQNQAYYAENGYETIDPDEGEPWSQVIPYVNSQTDAVNGICITMDADVIAFYRDVLPQGAESFMIQTGSFGGFADAIRQKLMREIALPSGLYD